MTAPSDAPPGPGADALDAVLSHERRRWQSFYEDRARPCPFFVTLADESLVEWIGDGRIAPGRALDVGCGHGRNAIFLARHGFVVDAVDHSESAIAWARERVAAANVPVRLIHRSIFDVPFESATYDLVYDSGCFHHLPPHVRADYIALVTRALRIGGSFGLTCFRPEAGSGYSDDQVVERGSLGGGLGYTEERLRALWSSPSLRIETVRPMREEGPQSSAFGKSFLWALLARKVAAAPHGAREPGGAERGH